jgi:hypothetical protein
MQYAAAQGAAQAYAPRFAQQGMGQQTAPSGFGLEGSNPSLGQQEFSGIGAPTLQHLSPQEFSGSLGRPQPSLTGAIAPLDTIFITELSRSARGLQDVAEQLEGKDQEAQRKGYFAATAHVFYVFGLLSSKGILIPSDLPGRSRQEGGSASSACREFGRVLDRVVDKYASRRGITEELSLLIERGKVCYSEITRGIETGQIYGTTGTTEAEAQQKRKAA